MVDPVLKWAGGKRQLLEEILARFPKEYGRYHEPMVGGGALFFAVEPAESTINDVIPRLVNFYSQVRDNPEDLVADCRSFREPDSKPDPSRDFSTCDRKGRPIDRYYYQQRAIFNRRPAGEPFDELEEAALFLYLNRTGFNGLYRENRDGFFNVPIGRYTNPDWVRADQVRAASTILQSTSIFNMDFGYVEKEAKAGDLVYFDPPYEPLSPTANFTDYSAEGFGRDEQERLLDTIVRLDETDVWVIVSNSGVMFDFYDDAGFFVDLVEMNRPISSDPSTRGSVEEIIATNVPESRRRGRNQVSLDSY